MLELCDLNPSADGAVVVVRTRTVPEREERWVREELSQFKGFRVRRRGEK